MPKPLRTHTSAATSTIEVTAPRTKGRRQFSVADKKRILQSADACAHGQLGEMLRKEGIYHSQLSDWRQQMASAGASGLASKRPGPTPSRDAKDREILLLNSKVKKLEKDLFIANGLVELQKKMQAMFSTLQQSEPPCTR